MKDIVEKYQYYMTEATRLQELSEEQAAYIEELEAALLELTEGAKRLERQAKALKKMDSESEEAKNLHGRLSAAGERYSKKMRKRERKAVDDPDSSKAEAIWNQKERTLHKVGNAIGRPIGEASDVNPWAACTASVGREDKDKYERCVMDIKASGRAKKE